MDQCFLTQPPNSSAGRRLIFPNDYTRDELVQYIVTLGAQAYDVAEQTAKLKARIRELESRLRTAVSGS